MEKPIRIDWESIRYAGEFFIKMGYAATAATETENHKSDLRLYYREQVIPVEVKVCRFNHNGGTKRLYPSRNSNWLYYPDSIDPDGMYWMLNALDGSGIGKFFQLTASTSGLLYIFTDGLLWFSPKALVEAGAGIGIYRTSRRMKFEASMRETVTPQAKMLIDLSKGKFTPCTPPESLFGGELNEDFNRENRRGKVH